MNYKLKKISGDASFREFYRVQKNSKSSIIVLANKEKFKNLITYAVVNQILKKNHILVPTLIKSFINKNIIEISDLGRVSFLDYIKKRKNILSSYKKAIDLIIKIQKIKLKKKYKFKNKVVKFENYTIKNLHKESDLFFNWYLKPLIKKNKFKTIKSKIRKELNQLYNQLYFKNIFFTHRDFHAANIMMTKNQLSLIDSQDAIIGNPLYDVMSLIDDVRIKIPNNYKEILFNYYYKKSKIKKERKINLKNDYDILSIQRNLIILGIFVRLFIRDKKPRYLKYLPHTWQLIDMRMKNPIFKRLRLLLINNLKIKQIKKAKFK
jgi:aminoglycoside/choline kinase family phosphotransferase